MAKPEDLEPTPEPPAPTLEPLEIPEMARTVETPAPTLEGVPAQDRLRLSTLLENTNEPGRYEDFVRKQTIHGDKERSSFEALRLVITVLRAENVDLKQQILDLNKKLKEGPATAELRQRLEDVTAERNEMALRLARESSRDMSLATNIAFDHLKAVFADPNRKKQAKREQGVENEGQDLHMGFDAFVEKCHRTADGLASIDLTKEHDKPQRSATPASRGQSESRASRSASTTNDAAVTTTPGEKVPPGGWALITAEERLRCRVKGLSAFTAARRAT
ncbi:hypothetical protein BDW66DRAFT_155192 [Aspergillus desertorum]